MHRLYGHFLPRTGPFVLEPPTDEGLRREFFEFVDWACGRENASVSASSRTVYAGFPETTAVSTPLEVRAVLDDECLPMSLTVHSRRSNRGGD
jgi:hypothetical protein